MLLIAESTHIQLLELEVIWWWLIGITGVYLRIEFLDLDSVWKFRCNI